VRPAITSGLEAEEYRVVVAVLVQRHIANSRAFAVAELTAFENDDQLTGLDVGLSNTGDARFSKGAWEALADLRRRNLERRSLSASWLQTPLPVFVLDDARAFHLESPEITPQEWQEFGRSAGGATILFRFCRVGFSEDHRTALARYRYKEFYVATQRWNTGTSVALLELTAQGWKVSP
jgi:hypothetical protein